MARLIVAVIVAVTLIAAAGMVAVDNRADVAQAQAAIDAARAAPVSARAPSTGSVALAIAIVVMGALLAAETTVVILLYVRIRRNESRLGSGWKSGPNARWGRTEPRRAQRMEHSVDAAALREVRDPQPQPLTREPDEYTW